MDLRASVAAAKLAGRQRSKQGGRRGGDYFFFFPFCFATMASLSVLDLAVMLEPITIDINPTPQNQW
jgi:hypothetical protein